MTRDDILTACESRCARDRLSLRELEAKERAWKAKEKRELGEFLATRDQHKVRRKGRFMHRGVK